jgi:hypothetical protein
MMQVCLGRKTYTKTFTTMKVQQLTGYDAGNESMIVVLILSDRCRSETEGADILEMNLFAFDGVESPMGGSEADDDEWLVMATAGGLLVDVEELNGVPTME